MFYFVWNQRNPFFVLKPEPIMFYKFPVVRTESNPIPKHCLIHNNDEIIKKNSWEPEIKSEKGRHKYISLRADKGSFYA